jgi:hypothetical protein
MLDLTLDFHALTLVPERDSVLVGRPDIESYAVFPVDGAALLQRLMEGVPPHQAARWYGQTYGEPIDIADFVSALGELGFLRAAEDEMATASQDAMPLQRVGEAVFSQLAGLCYVVLAAACSIILYRVPALLPRPSQIFFSPSLVLVETVLFFGQIPCVLFHESFHMLAGRRLGLPSRLRVSRRMYYVVYETTLNGLLSVPRRRRYLPFLCGMLADFLLYSALICFADLVSGRPGSPMAWLARLALALAFTTLIRFAWQFYLFLQTDLYYVFATALGCHDLHEATRTLLHNRVRRLLGRHRAIVDDSQWTDRDRQVARWYAPFYALGVLVMIGFGLLALAPVAAGFAIRTVQGLRTYGIGPHFWDTALSLVFTSSQFIIVLVLIIRERHQRRTAGDHSR